jgi:hypothetical protein
MNVQARSVTVSNEQAWDFFDIGNVDRNCMLIYTTQRNEPRL